MAAKPMTGAQPSTVQPTNDQIAQRAREIWMRRGSPAGRDLEHWLDAERELRDEMANRSGRKSSDALSPAQRKDPVEAEKRLDGLIEQPPSPASRTPAGEQL